MPQPNARDFGSRAVTDGSRLRRQHGIVLTNLVALSADATNTRDTGAVREAYSSKSNLSLECGHRPGPTKSVAVCGTATLGICAALRITFSPWGCQARLAPGQH